jgi:hypothetical protein
MEKGFRLPAALMVFAAHDMLCIQGRIDEGMIIDARKGNDKKSRTDGRG